eukprot:s281_g9.t1
MCGKCAYPQHHSQNSGEVLRKTAAKFEDARPAPTWVGQLPAVVAGVQLKNAHGAPFLGQGAWAESKMGLAFRGVATSPPGGRSQGHG